MVYFIYSKAQFDLQSNAYGRMGKTYEAGTVMVNGEAKPYTTTTSDIEQMKKIFGDSIILAKFDDIKEAKYTKPKARVKRRS